MAEMTIKLKCDPVTGKKDIIISLRSDEDALPHEHEQQHKALVDKLIEGGVLQASDVGKVVVEREEEAAQPSASVSSPEQSHRQAQAEGSSRSFVSFNGQPKASALGRGTQSPSAGR